MSGIILFWTVPLFGKHFIFTLIILKNMKKKSKYFMATYTVKHLFYTAKCTQIFTCIWKKVVPSLLQSQPMHILSSGIHNTRGPQPPCCSSLSGPIPFRTRWQKWWMSVHEHTQLHLCEWWALTLGHRAPLLHCFGNWGCTCSPEHLPFTQNHPLLPARLPSQKGWRPLHYIMLHLYLSIHQ